MREGDIQTVRVLKALADETRLEIVRMLCEEELCACDILEKFDITQPTLSYHMRILADSGLVMGRRDGAWIWYTLNRECFAGVKRQLNEFCEKIKNSESARGTDEKTANQE